MINLLVDSLSLASAAVVLMLSLTIVCFGSSSLMWGICQKILEPKKEKVQGFQNPTNGYLSFRGKKTNKLC
jgi:hypothetical protein